MDKVKFDFEYCYGIKKLSEEFDFSWNKKSYAIYAPNGTMKTSFAKTLIDFSNGEDSKDLAYPDRKTKREVINWDGSLVDQDAVFVIKSYDETFTSERLSTLLINPELKKEYDNIYQELENWENDLIRQLKELSKSTDCKGEILNTFSTDWKKTFLDILKYIKEDLNEEQLKYDFKYNDIFDSKGNVKKFLENFRDQIKEYVNKYNQIVGHSSFFSNEWNKFGTYQAKIISDAVKDNSFFEAGHKLKLKDNQEISSLKAYQDMLNDEIERVINDKDLKELFEKIDKAIDANTELRAFHKVLDKDNSLLVKLMNYENFKKEVWISYLYQLKASALALIKLYEEKLSSLEAIVQKARATITLWQEAIDEFNDRFINMPFNLAIENQEDAMLKLSHPLLKFYFKDWSELIEQSKESLLTILSQWEKRAFYLLNIIFEIQARKKAGQETIFIIDDIADSFDYKNKYAIIQYLKDINNEENFYQIILTHNFDFFRVLNARGIVKREACRMVIKTEDMVKVVSADGLDPISYFKKNFHKDSKILIAIIPFIRQLSDYCGFSDLFSKLTSLLHIKQDSKGIKISDLESMIKNVVSWINVPIVGDTDKSVLDLIFEVAEWICSEENEWVLHLENKIVLSIAIRLRAEKYMIEKINDWTFVNEITTNQTIKLFEQYKSLFPNETEQLNILDEVNLITPENIHLNSFMYEPILDMSEEFLKKLYNKIKNL